MMLPNQINNQRFSAVGKGGYRSSEVDAFIQRVYQNYNKLYNDNNILKERLSSITPMIEEYNDNKKSIADALIWAKATSDKTIEQAHQEAKEIIVTAKVEGEKIIADKKAEAQAVYSQELSETKSALEKATKELDFIRNQAKAFSEKYIAEINSKAAKIIEEANADASKIVADAYSDAKIARDNAGEIVSKANTELEAIKTEGAKLKAEIEKVIRLTVDSFASISISEEENISLPETEKVEAKQIDTSEIEKFDFTEEFFSMEEETEEPAVSESSFTVETVIDDEPMTAFGEAPSDDDFISGGSTAMPDVSEYITKIFESAGSEDSDFSSFTDGLNDAFVQSLGDSDINFDELLKNKDDEEDSDEE